MLSLACYENNTMSNLRSVCVKVNIIYTWVTPTKYYNHRRVIDPCQEKHKYVTQAPNNELGVTLLSSCRVK